MSARAHFSLGRLPTGQMNKTEAAYAAHLEILKRTGDIRAYWFEALKLRLADKTFFTPDFLVLGRDNQVECHEVKGFWQDDARVKIKVAAAQYPFRFRAVKKRGSFWDYEEF